MTDSMLKEFKQDIESYTLIPSDKGRFEVVVDGNLVFSKLAEGRFPEYKEIQPKIKDAI